MGMYPPPELLLCVVEDFDEYLKGDGSKDLEKIFFPKPVKGVGNYAAQYGPNCHNGLMLRFSIELNSKDNKNKSQIEIAQKFIEDHYLSMQPESLIREYRRYNANQRKSESDN